MPCEEKVSGPNGSRSSMTSNVCSRPHREGRQGHHHPTHVSGQVGNVFKAAGIALPPNLDEQPA